MDARARVAAPGTVAGPVNVEADRWQRVKEIFSDALDKPAADRPAYLDAACGDDAGLRAEVDSLLGAHDTTGDFIEKPAAQRALGIPPEVGPVSWIGRRVGDYRLVEEVGRGGMSEVYKAVRDDDEYHKEVAVKVLRRGYDTKALLKRFKIEVQILATLDHPNIARLLDAGSTPEGLPYLVMDYIQGRPIDDYCSFHRLGVRGRLDLFRQLCSAVQYVHQHLMVHGDLKCSNVLVSDKGTVKLLDFGIARLLNPTPSLAADHKLTGVLALTPEFASPEQIRGGPITTSSDVYSLGVVLYRLLTGVLPHRARGSGPSEFSFDLATQIVEQDALTPSVTAKAHENGETLGFARQLRGDLDNVLLMALERNPAKRYSSVERFDDDIRRHIEGFPVAARSASYVYQLTKFVGRHKAGITAIMLLVVTLVGGIFSTTRQARIAEIERERAERHFDEVRKLANVFMFDVHGAIADLPGSTPARQMLVENSLTYLEALAAESDAEPTLQRELASAYEKVGDVQGGFRNANLGDVAGAISSHRKALAMRQALVARAPQDRELRRELLRSYGKLSEILGGDGDFDGAVENARQAARLAQQLVAATDATVEDRRNFGTAYLSLGTQLVRMDQVGDGLLFMKQGAAVLEALVADEPRDVVTRRNLALTYGRIAETLLDTTDRYAEAYQLQERGFEMVEGLAKEDPRSSRISKISGYALMGMGEALARLGRPREALQKQLQAVELLRATFDADPRNEVARYDTAYALGEASDTDIALGDLASAERRLTDALAILSRAANIADLELNDTKVLLGMNYFRLGRTHAARALAAGRGTSHTHACREARKWFDLSRPILVAAEADGQWRRDASGKTAQIDQELAGCARVIAAAH